MQKLEDYMGEGAMDTNENIGGVEDQEEVYIPGAGCLGKLNNLTPILPRLCIYA